MYATLNKDYYCYYYYSSSVGDMLDELEQGYQTVKCLTAVKKRNPIHVLPVLHVRCSKKVNKLSQLVFPSNLFSP